MTFDPQMNIVKHFSIDSIKYELENVKKVEL